MQENIQEWFELDEDHGFLLLTEEGTASAIFFIYMCQLYLYY
jgi:hypothetical protein